jgi:hypothetical protein
MIQAKTIYFGKKINYHTLSAFLSFYKLDHEVCYRENILRSDAKTDYIFFLE